MPLPAVRPCASSRQAPGCSPGAAAGGALRRLRLSHTERAAPPPRAERYHSSCTGSSRHHKRDASERLARDGEEFTFGACCVSLAGGAVPSPGSSRSPGPAPGAPPQPRARRRRRGGGRKRRVGRPGSAPVPPARPAGPARRGPAAGKMLPLSVKDDEYKPPRLNLLRKVSGWFR